MSPEQQAAVARLRHGVMGEGQPMRVSNLDVHAVLDALSTAEAGRLEAEARGRSEVARTITSDEGTSYDPAAERAALRAEVEELWGDRTGQALYIAALTTDKMAAEAEVERLKADMEQLKDSLRQAEARGAGPVATSPSAGWAIVPREPTEAMLKAAWVAMNATPSGTWKRMKAEGETPRRLFDVKMVPRYRAMIAAAPPPPTEAHLAFGTHNRHTR